MADVADHEEDGDENRRDAGKRRHQQKADQKQARSDGEQKRVALRIGEFASAFAEECRNDGGRHDRQADRTRTEPMHLGKQLRHEERQRVSRCGRQKGDGQPERVAPIAKQAWLDKWIASRADACFRITQASIEEMALLIEEGEADLGFTALPIERPGFRAVTALSEKVYLGG